MVMTKIISSSSKEFAKRVISMAAITAALLINPANATDSKNISEQSAGNINIGQLEGDSMLKKVAEYHKNRIMSKFKVKKVNEGEIYNRMSLMLNFYSEVESSNNSKAINNNPDPEKRTTAQGSYQVVKGSIVPALNRLFKSGVSKAEFPEIEEIRISFSRDIEAGGNKYKEYKELSHEIQSAIILADLFQKKGTDKKAKKILLADSLKQIKDGIFKLYEEDHHTKTDIATNNRLENLYPKYAENIGVINPTYIKKKSKYLRM